MPIHRCKRNGKYGWKWGDSGKCYVGPGAKAKAQRQANAIYASGYTGNAAPNPLRMDPTRTATLRRKFETALARKLNELWKDIQDLVVVEDAFGLSPRTQDPFSGTAGKVVIPSSEPAILGKISSETLEVNFARNERFRFQTTPEQVEAFRNWLAGKARQKIVGGGTVNDDDMYWRQYVVEGYQQGAGRAFEDVRKKGRDWATPAEGDFFQGSKNEFLRQSFAHPVSVEKVKLLAGRVFTELNGVTDAIGQQLTRSLADGLTRGQSPREIARSMRKEIDLPARRLRMIAQTEIIRAHAEGQLDAIERLGVTEVGAMVEWSTSGLGVTAKGNPSPCSVCAPLKGMVLKIEEARGMIPRHPFCRCSWIPSNVGEDEKDQIRSKESIESAIEKSVSAELPSKKRTLAEKIRDSRWAGADTKPTKERPKSILTPPPAPPPPPPTPAGLSPTATVAQKYINQAAVEAWASSTQSAVEYQREFMKANDERLSVVVKDIAKIDSNIKKLEAEAAKVALQIGKAVQSGADLEKMKVLETKWHTINNKIVKARDNRTETALAIMRRHITKTGANAVKNVKFADVLTVPGYEADLNKVMEKSKTTLRGVIPGKLKSQLTRTYIRSISPGESQRAFFQEVSIGGQPTISMSSISPSAKTLYHEMGHALEMDPNVRHAAKGFLYHRVGEEPAVQMGANYGPSEVGRKDDFEKSFGHSAAYVGKYYPDGSTEVVSMGMQEILTDPVAFARNDPEYFKFMMSLLDGSRLAW